MRHIYDTESQTLMARIASGGSIEDGDHNSPSDLSKPLKHEIYSIKLLEFSKWKGWHTKQISIGIVHMFHFLKFPGCCCDHNPFRSIRCQVAVAPPAFSAVPAPGAPSDQLRSAMSTGNPAAEDSACAAGQVLTTDRRNTGTNKTS